MQEKKRKYTEEKREGREKQREEKRRRTERKGRGRKKGLGWDLNPGPTECRALVRRGGCGQ